MAESDTSQGMRRTELKCSRCDAHLDTSLMMDRNPPGFGIAINSVALELDED